MISFVRSRVISVVALCALLSVTISCGGITPPPTSLSAAGALAFNQMRATKAVDLIRDTAIAANAQTPAALSTNTTRLVVTFHEATVKTINAAGTGWPTEVRTAADNFIKGLSPADQAIIKPYITLLDTLLESF